jgi:hypothetical protein
MNENVVGAEECSAGVEQKNAIEGKFHARNFASRYVRAAINCRGRKIENIP